MITALIIIGVVLFTAYKLVRQGAFDRLRKDTDDDKNESES